ncbi:hypothetical protein LR48_Vigan293s000400 [Vigna angularis]|uniref:Aminotransferase-like plant mobile domain-containing protein n=1 Tax=Phaseolus angularis TaxID=3914 RepID=A0A0L9T7K8_PHAAN|nr:hypothetical protein LR48_Vigan293s000400 [Vigna angularis]
MLFGQRNFDTDFTTPRVGSALGWKRRAFNRSIWCLALSLCRPSSKLPSSLSFSPPSSIRAFNRSIFFLAVWSIFTLIRALNPSIFCVGLSSTGKPFHLVCRSVLHLEPYLISRVVEEAVEECYPFLLVAVSMEGKKPSWRLLISMDSSIIIQMNRLLRQCHVERIRMTPFMWCLNIQSPVEVNLKLLKVMVCRWVGHDNSFRVSQQLVPFRVIDVFMSIGLEIGGLEIPFDEVVVGLVGEMFKSKTISLKDLTDMFNVIVHDKNIDVDVVLLDDLDSLCLYDWCTGVHKHIVENLNKCKKKIMRADIAQSLTLSGNVAVLKAWAVERLSLHGHPSHRFFPRIMRWFPYKSRTEKIEHIFMTGDLNMEWYLRKEDRHRSEIRAAFKMDDGGMSEGSLAEGSKVEKDDDDDESSDDRTWEAGAEERLRKNNEDIRALNAKIGVLTRELFEICQTPIFTEADACGTDEEVGGGVDEAPEVGGEEKPEVGGDEEAEVGPDCGFEEEGHGNAVHDPLGAYTEVRGEDKTAHEEEIVSRTVHNIHCIEIDDDGDEEEREVVPLVIPPLRSFVGDPSTTVDVDQLYRAISVREMTVYRVVCEIIGQTLSTTSFYTLAPIKYVDNMEELLGIRKKYVCDWILDNENIRRMEALQLYGIV